MNDISIYPWQSDLFNKITQSKSRLPHALLLRGRKGIGKADFAKTLAKSLLCYTPQDNGFACNNCSACAWFDLGNHPDYKMLTPTQDESDSEDEGATGKKPVKKSQQISVVQVRELSNFFELSSHQDGGVRIIVIQPAEALNAASANSLLKILEEPPSGVIFLLVAHHADRLLPTIISRCQVVDMPVPTYKSAVEWLSSKGIPSPEIQLDYSGGAPLVAIENAQGQDGTIILWKLLSQGEQIDAFAAAPLFLSQGMEFALTAMQKWIYDLLACRMTGEIRYHRQHASALQALGKRVDLKRLLDFQVLLDKYRKSANHPLSNEVQLENLLVQYAQTFSVRA